MYAEVILPLPLKGTFTYSIPALLRDKVSVGSRVIVQFGARKIFTGIVYTMHENKVDYVPKTIEDVLDEEPVINEVQLRFFSWIASYYLCTLGEVINAALPSALKLSSQSFVSLKAGIDFDQLAISDREASLVEHLIRTEISIKDAGELLGLKYPQRVIKGLSEKGIIDLYEKVKDRFIPKKEKRIRLADLYVSEDALETMDEMLAKKPKQQAVIEEYLKVVDIFEDASANERGIAKADLAKHVGKSSLQTLVKNGIFKEWEETVSRLEQTEPLHLGHVTLSKEQQVAFDEINSAFTEQTAVLLHGATGSGKTEVYIELIVKMLSEGKQVLYLLPEIALTTQIIARLHRVFGNSFGVYHSRYSENERVEVWHKVLKGEFQFVVGVRSAVFLPFSDLGLIVVDEEHEPSYKQYDPAPRYHARDSAIFLATLHQSKVLLGSATPSLEAYQNTVEGKFGKVELSKRFGDTKLPSIQFANTADDKRFNRLKGNFSPMLTEAIQESLDREEQVILFQNRRGYAAYISCDECATIPKCVNCAVSLTYHQYNNRLVCHYCGFNQPMISECGNCGSHSLSNVGFGTEELEEELHLLFPDAVVQRMDLDTTRSKNSYQRIIEEFEEGYIDILVGTQMVSKGLDFDKVDLVGIFDTDRMIHYPDFRSHERAYDLITQVSGRAGRKSGKGKVIIQTNDPDQPLLGLVTIYNYQRFFEWEAMERKNFGYPPFSRIIKITFKHREKDVAYQGAVFYAKEVRKEMGHHHVLGPVEPIIGKLRNQYIYEMTIKLGKSGVNLAKVKSFLESCAGLMSQVPAFKNVGVFFDVDPV